MGYAVAAGHPLAVDEADRALGKGANAVEAALVAAFVQGVVDPAKCGIGGWGVAAVGTSDGAVTIIDFPARAGGRARPDMWRELLVRPAYHGYLPVLKGNANDVGYQAIGVPSAVAGYAELHARGASWSWADLLVPAIRYARDGVPVYGGVLGAGPPEWDWPGAVPFADRLGMSAAGGRRYLRGNRFFHVGEILRQPELAVTLETLASGGPAAFYQGPIADRIARDMARHGGLITAEDLATCRPAVTRPVVWQFGPWAVHAPPPPESGVSLLQVLAALDGTLDSAKGPFGTRNVRELAAALEFAAVQRGRYLSDPAFVEVPIAAMLAEAAARRRGSRLRGAGAHPNFRGVVAQRDTTSVVVADEQGLVVSMNHSLVSHGGSGVVTRGLGFLYNNTMAGFDVEPGGRNSIEPGRARWSAACPTIVTGPAGDLRLAITGPGGSRAIGAVAQGLLNMLAFGMGPLQAVSLPRIDAHDGVVDLEGAVPWSVEADLVDAGVRVNRTYESGFAALYAVGRDGNVLAAAADPRRTGAAIAV